jgi:diketogulonate reductase-like aldo/keto reductase
MTTGKMVRITKLSDTTPLHNGVEIPWLGLGVLRTPVEFHPYLQQPQLQAFCREHHIQMEAWRPIMKGQVMQVPELVALGQKYGKNPVRITLRWILQCGIVAIPKSVQQQRIRANADIFDFELEADDLALIDRLDRNQRLGADPDNFDF